MNDGARPKKPVRAVELMAAELHSPGPPDRVRRAIAVAHLNFLRWSMEAWTRPPCGNHHRRKWLWLWSVSLTPLPDPAPLAESLGMAPRYTCVQRRAAGAVKQNLRGRCRALLSSPPPSISNCQRLCGEDPWPASHQQRWGTLQPG